ncbi:hypothetical protein BAUCODRAFT_76636 [Baudoinia panamericana UAMH 10762]|uniref:Uncharacterized protein n=1 Tax=Baudoinia panamericana (strain UAMH 10762) TaxID=717646 RepID=M2M9J7_BAUPA|nr:uncharacterized protein BAUCODRAFT_76636 [Baudoinia panamericana UAMH 10762]EMC93086.1 hypothetical protein BAUCODRAFT_76636 [Baudoinia panamericana UAMH 10762]
MPTSFEWLTTAPIKIRPFKPKYHLTMGLENMPLSELIQMDKTYADRIQLRRNLISEHPTSTRQCNPCAEKAVAELYEWIISTYLPKRFPSTYKLTSAETGSGLRNLVTDKLIPLQAPSSIDALELLGENVDTDFLVLLPSSKAADGSPVYHLEAFVTCFPSGFSTREKCGKPLAAIHNPVPGYASKLERSMDRFFARLEVGKAVKRVNWSITTNDRLFSESGNHMYSDEEPPKPAENAKTLDASGPNIEDEIAKQKLEVVVEDCRLRCERQTLHRLPNTNALVFAFKTYLYKLSEVKDEGLGPALADAVDGLGTGSVPDMAFYKRGVVWGEKVKEYLRS